MGMLFLVFAFLAVLAGLVSLVGFVLLDVQAFRQSPLWGLLVLFLSPIAALIYAIRNWEEARRAFLIYAGGFAGSVVLSVMAMGAGVGAAVTSAANEIDHQTTPRSSGTVLPASGDRSEAPARQPDVDAVIAAVERSQGSEPAEGLNARTLENTGELTEEPATIHVATDLLEPQDERARRTLDRAMQRSASEPDQDDDAVPVGYTLVAFGDADDYLGRRVRVLDKAGNVHEGTLSQASSAKLVIERELTGGSISYELKPSDVASLQIYFR